MDKSSTRLVVGCMASDLEVMARAVERLAARFGPLSSLSEAGLFEVSTYYRKEMGSPLLKRLAVFENPYDPSRLESAKRICLSLEKDFAESGRRRVNLDPGLLSPDSLILASTKHAPHRVCLGSGLHAEITLVYREGEYRTLSWTYPDYAAPTIRGMLKKLRGRILWRREK